MVATNYESVMLEHFFDQMPFIQDQMAYCYRSGPRELTAVLKDGSRAVFNDLFGRTTFLSKPSEACLGIEECSKRFGIRLRALMNDRMVNQQELSARTGISQSAISKYATGSIEPKASTIVKLARALECSVSDLMSYCEDPTY